MAPRMPDVERSRQDSSLCGSRVGTLRRLPLNRWFLIYIFLAENHKTSRHQAGRGVGSHDPCVKLWP